jgi:hypothetical protein
MPIRPEMRGLYPKDWKTIRRRILERAKDHCEFCGVPNHATIRRVAGGWVDHQGCSLCLGGERCGAVFIVLTVAHLDHQPAHCDEANLRALCQRCHLRYDAEEHAKNSAATRARKRDERTGQASLFTEDKERG